MKIFLCTWPFGAGGDPRDMERGMKLYLGDAQGRAGGDLQADCLKVSSSPAIYLGAPTGPAIAVDLPAIGRKVQHAQRPLRLLLSYHYYKDENVKELLDSCFKDQPVDIFADSGAYSSWTTGTPITVKEYADWLLRWGDLLTCAAALDVIGNAQGSWDQTGELKDLLQGKLPNLDLIPVVHINDRDPWSWLSRYVGAGYKYIGIAPNAVKGNQKLKGAWMAQGFKRRPPDVKYHGFGVTSWDHLLAFPWYSVDSSSWTSGFRYAQLALFDSKRGCFVNVAMGQKKSLLENAGLLAQYGLRPTTAQAHSYDRDLLCGVCVESWQRAEEWLSCRSSLSLSLSLSLSTLSEAAAAGPLTTPQF